MKKFALLLVLLILLSSLFSLTSCSQEISNEPTEETSSETTGEELQEDHKVSLSYILNKNTKKFHKRDCYAVDMMDEENKIYFTGSRSEAINQGYKPCLKCNP